MTMEIDLPEPLAELEAAFRRYETALVETDVGTLASARWRVVAAHVSLIAEEKA